MVKRVSDLKKSYKQIANFIKKSTDFEKAFEEFYNSRKSKIEKLVKQSRMTSKIAITNRPFELIRNLVLKYTPRKFMEKQMLDLYTIDKTVATNI